MELDTLISQNKLNEAVQLCIKQNKPHMALLLYKLSENDGNINTKHLSHVFQTLFQNDPDLQHHVINRITEITENTYIPQPLKPFDSDSIIIKQDPPSPPMNQIVQDNTVYLRVFLICNWCSSEDLCILWNKMSKDNNYSWDNIKICWEEPADYYCIINKPQEGAKMPVNFDKKKTILFQMEPFMAKNKNQWGEEWFNPDPNDYLFCGKHDAHFNNNEWHLSKTYSELSSEPIVKDDNLSTVVSAVLSDKYKDRGQVKRINFAKFVDGSPDVTLHVFGSDKFLWNNYKGVLPPHYKDGALFPYKYTFNAENNSIKNYYTEKLIDGILAECLVFYNGCYNAREFLGDDAFVYLELSNNNKDISIMKKAISENWWEKRLPAIREAKQKILNQLQFFPRIKMILDHYSKEK